MMQLFLYLLAVVAVHSAPSGLLTLSERDSSSGSDVDPATISTSPFVTFSGLTKRSLLYARYRSAPAINPYIIQRIGSYSFANCYTESTVPPALSRKFYSSNSMTLEICAATCEGFQWFGVKDAQNCYCGDAFEADSVPEPDGVTTQCNLACKGNPFELCGGSDRLQVYRTVQSATATTSTSSAASKSSPSIPSTSSASFITTLSTTSSSSIASTATPSTTSSSTITPNTLNTSSTISTSTTSTATSATSYTTSSTASTAAPSTTSSTITSSTSTTSSTTSKSTTSSTTSTTSSTTSSTTTTSTTSSTTLSTTSTSKTSSTSSSKTSSSTQAPHTTGRAVFAHYMISGITQTQANTDVQQAQAMGIDGFALNVGTATASWSNDALQCLFNAARGTGFKLFLSFDMTSFSSPSDAIPLLQHWYTDPSYYNCHGTSFVSTFNGGTMTFGYPNPNAGWQAKYRDALNSLSIPTYFVPVFDDSPVDPSSFFNDFPVVDGLFAWENSWPWGSPSTTTVSSTKDQQYFSAAQLAGKSYMMGISSVQFKHMQPYLNYYRTGGLDLALRISQILSLRPDFVQIQSWNDAGESHYIGSIWPYALSGTNVGSYTNGYDHSGWQILLTPFIAAYKAGITDVSQLVPTSGELVQGVFWHNTLLSTASCYGDSLGQPSGSQYIQDTIEVAVIVAPGFSGVMVNVFSGNQQVGSYNAVQGLNAWEVQGLQVGQVRVVVTTHYGATMISGTGPINVQSDSNNCNYNPQVVGLS